ncbi:hypothetical protein BN946_scf184517.g3 [Trametes cinnabarina]|uniref:Uncharacterized protein n=1 Tax=Pycnoporus cinnabarinus TaxID=5643 RepID=A0A060SLS4_PYCCI|nr:hypothetical protein BN946_scf184517.g3 [Trametes cinnabarina]
MVLRYEEVGQLSNGHDRGITKLAFSPSGSYISTAGLDGKTCVWDVDSTQLLYSFDGQSPVLSLLWVPPNEDTLVCGFLNGNIAVLQITAASLRVKECWAHAFPVECLAIRPIDNQLASGAHRELFIWLWNESAGRFQMSRDISGASKKAHDDSNDVLITSVHWTESPQHANLLLVTYMHHGLVLLDAETWSRIRTIPLHGQIADASLSDDGQRLAISNVLRGFDIYSMQSGAPLCAIEHDNRGAYPIPVLFIHGGLALFGGSTTGELMIWDVIDTESGNVVLNTPEKDDHQPRLLHVLPVPQQAKALAISAFYNEQFDEFFIAAGMMNEFSESTAILWKAAEHGGTRTGATALGGDMVGLLPALSRSKWMLAAMFVIFCAVGLPQICAVFDVVEVASTM